jgi:raffinose/stachyose/melibiose transport system substrate-binding protein
VANPYLTQLSRRRFLILGGLSATAAGLAACGVGASSPSAVAPSAPGSTSPSASAAAKARLRYINHWTGQDGHAKTMDWLYQTFQERQSNVTLDVLAIPDYEQMKAKVQTECNSGGCPDILHAVTAADATSGILLDLTDWMTTNSDRFVGVAQEGLKIEGKNYGWSAEYGPVPVIWNGRLLEAAGVSEAPATWDELKAAGEKLAAKGTYLTSLGISPNAYFYSILFPMTGAKEAMEAGNWSDSTVVDAFAKLAEIVPYLPDNDAENDWDAAAKLFVSEKTAFEVNGPWTIGAEIEGEASPPDLKDVVAVTPFPDTGNGTAVYVDTFTFVGASAGTADDAAKAEAILAFFDFWTDTDAADRFISEAKSPMGVTTGKVTTDVAGPVLAQFYATIDSAKNPFTLTQKQRASNEYGAVEEATKALRLGKSADEATAVFAAKMAG